MIPHTVPTTWQERLDALYETMQEMSLQTDPQEMVRAYGRRVARLFPADRRISLSRRDLEAPLYRITRYSGWDDEINPWQESHRLPVLSGGLLGALIYSDRVHLIDDLELGPDDPAAPFLEGQRSLMAIPMLDQGQALNMVVSTRQEPYAFDRERLPDTFWLANLFGRATHNLVLTSKVQHAYDAIDREMRTVAEIQRKLLPQKPPDIPRMEVASYYETSARAGGDYYDFFPLPDGKWGLLIADVSGHGIPAAVVMAITHSIAHLYPNQSHHPSDLLSFVNGHLTRRYTAEVEAFVTAFYAVFDPETLTLTYANAGHNPPRLWHCSGRQTEALSKGGNLPMGLLADVKYSDASVQLMPGDRIVLYTDGIIEATAPDDALFGVNRLDNLLTETCHLHADEIIRGLVSAVEGFTMGAPVTDDRTLVIATIQA